jgi:hypothetical protein
MSAMARLPSNVIFKLEADMSARCGIAKFSLMESPWQNKSNLAVMIWFNFTAHVPHNLLTFLNLF